MQWLKKIGIIKLLFMKNNLKKILKISLIWSVIAVIFCVNITTSNKIVESISMILLALILVFGLVLSLHYFTKYTYKKVGYDKNKF